MAHEYVRKCKKQDYVQANLFLGNIAKQLNLDGINLTDDIKSLKEACNERANTVLQLRTLFPSTLAYKLAQKNAKRCEIDVSDTLQVGLKKLSCPEFWYRKIKQIARRRVEHVRRLCGIINAANQKYCSDFALSQFDWEQEQSKKYLESISIQNESGYALTLAEVASQNISNPRIRRTEMMVRIKGFEEVANLKGHVADHVTLTAPSRMHSHYASGQKNPKYDNTTVKEAADYLNNCWQCVRAKLDREELRFYGIRVVEAHHDGTPHWHMLIFMHPDDRAKIRNIISSYFIKQDAEEAGAKEKRVRFDAIDSEKGSATGYIAKYVSKNIDGQFLDSTNENQQPLINAKKIRKWARDNAIRQFQFFGGPSVTLWRELRKIDEIHTPETEKLRQVADAGDWAAYVILMGGVHLPRENRPFKLVYEHQETIDKETGEVIQQTDRYGSPVPPKIIGVVCDCELNAFLKHTWVRITSPPN